MSSSDTPPQLTDSQIQRDQYWMRQAMRLAAQAEAVGEIPVGAILVKDEQVIAQGFNESILRHDPSAHAEMQCIRDGGQVLENYRLLGTTLYVTLEPCAMCAGAIIHSRIARLVYGASDSKTGATGSVIDLLNHPIANHQVSVTSGVLAEECGAMLSAFFKRRRQEKKAEKQQKKAINSQINAS